MRLETITKEITD